ncbi:MAG: glycosyltransferase family 2 protein [Thermodesulfobacteriota bacterium]
MKRKIRAEQKDDLNPREISEEELARFVLEKVDIPVDPFAVAVILETIGIRDVDAVDKFGKKDVFDLADNIYSRCRAMLADMPELTAVMPAYNNGKHIGEAIESILSQDGVDFELIIVDDASEDNTVDVVQSFNDPRTKLIRNKRRMGFAYCYNLANEHSKSPFVTHVGADGLVLPGAFQKMLGELKSSPDIGQVNCFGFHVEEKNLLLRNITPRTHYKKELSVHGSITNHLRMYRREVFIVAGKFDETLRYVADYDMALRIVDKYDIRFVQELLYCCRIYEGSTTKLWNSRG